MGNNDNRVVTWSALNSYITQNGGSPKKSSGANNLALKYGEFSEYAPIATATSSGVVLSSTYTGTGGGAYTSTLVVIEKDVSWSTYETPVPTSIVVNPKTSTLDIGSNPAYPSSVQLSAIVTAPTGADTSVTWTSSNTQIASVDNTGLVTAHAVGGPVTITATTSNNLSDTATITVIQTDSPAIVTQYSISWSGAHAGISGSTSPVTLNEGSTWSGTFVADEGYEITNISTTGSNVTTNGNTVSVSDLLSNVTITVTTSQIVTPVTNYTITWSGNHASMTSMNPTISNGGQLAEGSSWTGTVVADNGYTVTNVTVNGSNATVNNNVVTISNLTGNVTITITTEQDVLQEPTLTANDITVRIGGTATVFNSWELSDNSIQIDSVQYQIADISIAEIEGEEQYELVLGKAVGTTTYTVTVNGTITGTGNITVIGILEGYDLSGNQWMMFDIFGNKSPLRDSYDSSSWNTGIQYGEPNGNWEGIVTYLDDYNNIQNFTIDVPNEEERQYMNEHIELSDNASWLTAHIEGGNIIVDMDPWTEKINDLIATAAQNTEYAQVTGKNAIMNTYGGTNGNYAIYYPNSSTQQRRVCTVTLHASDGTTLSIPIIQCCEYSGRVTSSGGENYGLGVDFKPDYIFESIDWYGPAGSNFTAVSSQYSHGDRLLRNANVQAFAVVNPASSVQGITGLPSIIIGTGGDGPGITGAAYDSSFVKLLTTTIP